MTNLIEHSDVVNPHVNKAYGVQTNGEAIEGIVKAAIPSKTELIIGYSFNNDYETQRKYPITIVTNKSIYTVAKNDVRGYYAIRVTAVFTINL